MLKTIKNVNGVPFCWCGLCELVFALVKSGLTDDTQRRTGEGGWVQVLISKLHYPECSAPLSLAYFVSLWHQMVHPRARSLISHHHLGTARNWSHTHPSLIKCCNGMQEKLPVLSGCNTTPKPCSSADTSEGGSIYPLQWPVQHFHEWKHDKSLFVLGSINLSIVFIVNTVIV